MGNISSTIKYGLSNSAESQGSHKLLRITDIQNGKVDWKTIPFTTTEHSNTYLLQKGDIVFARTGATVGKSFLIEETPYPSVYASYLIRIRLLRNMSPQYIYIGSSIVIATGCKLQINRSVLDSPIVTVHL